MKINGRHRISQWQTKHAQARKPLARWVQLVLAAEWESSKDVAQTFGRKADRVGGSKVVAWVFDIGGNKYRLVATIDFELQAVTPRFFMTHAEYDADRWKEPL